MAARTSGTSAVIQERNQRGFHHFPQNLKTVFLLFLTPENVHLTTEALVEARNQLLDARRTLSLLIVDLERGDPNPAGLPTNALQAPLQNLSESVAEMINILPAEIENREQAEEFGLSDEFERYSDITDGELDQTYAVTTGNSQEGPLTPNMGRRRFIGALRSRFLRIQRWRVSERLRRVDPVGTALRWRMTIHRRKHFVPNGVEQWGLPSRVRCDYGNGKLLCWPIHDKTP